METLDFDKERVINRINELLSQLDAGEPLIICPIDNFGGLFYGERSSPGAVNALRSFLESEILRVGNLK